MYQHYFGLIKDPFAMTPDPAFLYMTPGHVEAFAGLTYAVMTRKGFIVMTGEAGTGKTTLIAEMLRRLPTTQATALIFNPALAANELLEAILIDLGIKDIPASKARRLDALQKFLLETKAKGTTTILVIDEAQRLSPDLLEEVRLLSNYEHPDGKLLQILLVGQNELSDALNCQELRQLKQRISVRLSILPFTLAEVGEYIRHRWKLAGASTPAPFSQEAVVQIHRYSGGIPRVINAICDNALLLAYSEGTCSVTVNHIAAVARDFHLGPKSQNGTQNAAAAQVEKAVADAVSQSQQITATAAAGASVNIMPTLERYAQRPVPQPSTVWWRWMRKRSGDAAESI